MDDNDSRRTEGGLIPGLPGKPAFVLSGPEPSAIPVLIAVPHAGRSYPATLLKRMRHPDSAALRLEDRYADVLAESVAKATGAMLLVANAPRAMIDLNRAPDDIDWDMIEREEGVPDGIGQANRAGTRADNAGGSHGRRARTGLGLVPRRLPGIGDIWRRRLPETEIAERIAAIHEPYHAALAAALSGMRDRWGAALLVDLHSMPTLSRRGGPPAAEFVVGDRFGTTCHGSITARAFAYLGDAGRLAAHNRPYAGGYVLERHADTARGIHALQVEVDRVSYLDSRFADPGAGFAGIARLLSGLVGTLAEAVASLGGADPRWMEAAE